MIGIILISHGGMAAGVREAAEMIAGEQENMIVLGLYPGDTPEAFAKKLEQAIEELEQPGQVLILSDVHAGTPSNMADLMALEKGVFCISGINLPLLLDVLSLRGEMPVDQLTEIVCLRGKEGIQKFHQL